MFDQSISVKSNWINKANNIPNPKIKFEVHQYDSDDNELGVFYSEYDLFTSPNYKNYYYRIKPFLSTPRGRVYNEHFGVTVSNEGTNAFDMGVYWNQLLNYLITLSDTPEQLLKFMNGNLSWHYKKFHDLSTLDHSEFNKALSAFTSKFPFSQVNNLFTANKMSGIYLLVLDEYACCYMGQSKNIKTRIQQHWRKTNFYTDGIDMFKAFDTTRIYTIFLQDGFTQKYIDKLEYHFIHSIDRKYLLNFLGGGCSLEFIHSDSPTFGYGTDPAQ